MNENSNLEFRKIPSLKFLYEISEDGRIVRNVKSKKQLRIVLDKHHSKKGYYAFWTNVSLDGVRKDRRHMVHAIVAECWLGKRPEGLEIDHIDRNSHNNNYRNLRYVTHSEQMKNRVLSDRIIKQVIKNCQEWNRKISIGVRLLKGEREEHKLPSLMQAAIFLAKLFPNVKSEHFRGKLKKRRSHIFGYDVVYLNAETAR